MEVIDEMKVSIIVPVYNIQDYIGDCIESLINQTYKNIEIILVDDGSTDNSGIICDTYKQKDDRIQVIHQKNKGLSEARNIGVTLASGDYVVFVDGDDIVSLQLVKIAVTAIKKNSSNIAFWKYEKFIDIAPLVNNDTVLNDRTVNVMECLEQLLLHQINEEVWNGIYSRNIIIDEKFPIGKQNEDVFWKYKVIMHAGEVENIVYIDNVLSFYRIRSGSITQSPFSWGKIDSLEGRYYRAKDIIANYKKLKPIAICELYAEAMFIYHDVYTNLKGNERKLAIVKIYGYLKEIPLRFTDIYSNSKISKAKKLNLILSKVSFKYASLLKVYLLKKKYRQVN